MPPIPKPALVDDDPPLSGVVVLDLTSVVAGPAATLRLSDLGADVIKVEPPDGDLLRVLGGASISGSLGPKYMHFNRGKRSVGIDLKSGGGRKVISRLLERCDVLVSNIRPESLAKLQLDAESCLSAFPTMIHCTITGYGPGPYRGRPAYDTVIQGASGVAGLFDLRDGAPNYAPFLVADRIAGEIAATAITAMLLRRARTGRGGRIEIPMLESMASFVMQEHLGAATYRPFDRPPGDLRVLARNNLPVQTSDGWISITSNSDDQSHGLLSAIGRADLIDDPRFATLAGRVKHSAEWFDLRAQAFRARPTSYWLDALARAGVPAMPCYALDEVMRDPHLVQSGVFATVEHPVEGSVTSIGSPIRIDGGLPDHGLAPQLLGESTLTVLREFGFNEAEIEELVSSEAVVQPGLKAKARSTH